MNSRITQSARPKPTRTELEACRRNSGLPVLFTLTLFLSAALLFLIQPMFAKMVLPLLGGTPSVWNTCMVFFQAVLLAGYAYAHAAATRLGVRRQALLHLVLLLIPFLVLPISLAYASAPPADANPIPWLLCLLAVRVGLPFFVVATTSPLMQRWFARTGYPGGKDPYFLYSAGNLGSMLALLSYPVLFEPLTTLRTQSWIWMGGYGVLVAMILGCAFFLVRKPLSVPHGKEATSGDCGPQTTGYRLQTVQRLRWIVLAFVPSSLMLSVTTYLTTDLAAIPLLWVIPLAIYLLTFILVFARRPPIAPYLIYRVLPIVVVALVFAMLSQATKPLWLLLSLHLLGFFLISMACHGELARQRPPVEHLTEYYLWLSVGGVLGGLFNALIAPLIFRSVLEYPLVLMLGCMLPASTSAQAAASKQQPNRKPTRKQRRMLARAGERGSPEETACPPSPLSHVLVFETFLVLLPGALAAGLSLILRYFNLEKELFGMALIFGLPVLICYTFIQYRVRFGLAIGFLLFAGMSYQGVYGETV